MVSLLAVLMAFVVIGSGALIIAGWRLDVGGPGAALGEILARTIRGRDLYAQLNRHIARAVVTGLDGTPRMSGSFDLRASSDAAAYVGGTWPGLAQDAVTATTRYAKAHGVRVPADCWVNVWVDDRLAPRRLQPGRLFSEPIAAARVEASTATTRRSSRDEVRPTTRLSPTLQLKDDVPPPSGPGSTRKQDSTPKPGGPRHPAPTQTPGRVALKELSDDGATRTLTAFRNEIGRDFSSQLVLPTDGTASRRHASIWLDLETGSWLLGDRGSLNGTYVNHRRIDPRMPVVLRPGQLVAFGNALFRVVSVVVGDDPQPGTQQ